MDLGTLDGSRGGLVLVRQVKAPPAIGDLYGPGGLSENGVHDHPGDGRFRLAS
jgi:hypothetical protein